MTHRPATTLLEVLIAMFIMAIGMLALLVLFPLGAISMGQALKDDRCASTAAMAGNVANAHSVRIGDANVIAAFANTNPAFGTPNSSLVYVDPYGAIMMPLTPPYGVPLGAVPGVYTGIPRVYPSFVVPSNPPLALTDRWFSLPDDIGFTESATPDLSSGILDRGRRYSYAYLLRKQQGNMLQTNFIDLHVVVYRGRPTGVLTPERTYTALGTPAALGTVGQNGITVNATGGNPWPPQIKRGRWILDPVNGYFYRVTNIVEMGASVMVEVQQPLSDNVNLVTVMPYVSEVFDKGTGWQLMN